MAFFDSIEIGTANFRSEVQTNSSFLRHKKELGLLDEYNGRILSIEPVKRYLDELPVVSGCYKEHAAVSNHEGEVDVWYISPENLVKYGFQPEGFTWSWMVGCNSINSPHATMLRLYDENRNNPEHKMYQASLLDVFSVDKVKCHNIKSLFEKYQVEGVTFLKVDTEGHDRVILFDYFDYCEKNPHLKAKWIMHESNQLMSDQDKEAIRVRADEMGYDSQGLDGNLCFDRLLTLRK